MMKTFTTINLKKLKIYSILLFAALTGLSACKKTETTDTTVSYLRVVNASPALATYYAYLNGTALTSAALPFAGSTAFASREAGTYPIKFTSENTTESLYTKSITMAVNTYQSFYLINKPGALDGLLLTDDSSVPATDKAYIRFINLSPDAPALDLAKTAATASYTTNKSYKASSGFMAIDPGTFTLDAKLTSTGAVKVTSASTTFVAGYRYDVICGGLVTPASTTERALSLNIITIK